jgi:hypothetical protein
MGAGHLSYNGPNTIGSRKIVGAELSIVTMQRARIQETYSRSGLLSLN